LRWTGPIDCVAPARNSAVVTDDSAAVNQIGLNSKDSVIDLHVHPCVKVVNRGRKRGKEEEMGF